MYPDLSLYPADSVPNVVQRINNALRREDEKQHMVGNHDVDWFVPIVAHAEAGFGGPLHAFERRKPMIEAGAARVHCEDRLAAAYNCSASFNWRKKLDPSALAEFQQELGRMGYRFQFVTLAGFHTLNLSMFELASRYADRGMTAYAELQDDEFAARERGYRATEHQAFVGTEFFDAVSQVISGGTSSTLAMKGSTEREQIADATARFPVSARS